MDMVGVRLCLRLGEGDLASSSLSGWLALLFSSVPVWHVVDGLLVGIVHSLAFSSVSDSASEQEARDGSMSKTVETAEDWEELVEARERTVLHIRGGRMGEVDLGLCGDSCY